MLEVDLRRELAAFDLCVRLEVGREILALFGPSGAGKSMLLKMVAGIEHPTAGWVRSGERILFDSEAKVDLPPQQRRAGYVPQQYALFPHLTALANVAFPLEKGKRMAAGPARERARQLLETFGLGDRIDAHPVALSGGQQQRVALARALATEPEMLLLDEPFAALDGPVRIELRQELRVLQGTLRIPTIFVTHDLDEAAAIAGRMAVIVDGQIRQAGPVRDVIDRPVDARVAELVQARNILPGILRRTGSCASIETGFANIPVDAAGFPDGTSVRVVIRPEFLRVAAAEDAPETPSKLLIRGRVVELVDEGLRRIIRVAAGDSVLVVAATGHRDAGSSMVSGSEIGLIVSTDDVHLIPEPTLTGA